MRFGLLAIALCLGASASALAQTGGDAPVGIVVHGDSNTVRQYVNSIAMAPPSETLARWNNALCVGVAGAQREAAQAIIDRVSRRADALGLRAGEPGCTPNLMVIITSDSDRVAHDVYERRHETLTAPNGISASTLGDAALTEFVNTPRPIRWWHVAQEMTGDGETLTDTRSSPTQSSARSSYEMSNAAPGEAGGGEGMSGVQTTRSDGTRLRNSTRQDLNYVLVIVDTRRMNGANVGAIGDYVAFVSLAQVNPNVNAASYPSILNLFNDQNTGQRPAAMTEWDLAYLDGLYHATRTARTARQQQDEIARRMTSGHS